MLPDLTDQFISDNYGGLIHTSNTPITSTDLTQLYDGLGNPIPIQVSSTKLKFGLTTFPLTGGSDGDVLVIRGGSNEAKFESVLDLAYPVGSVYLSVNTTNPSSLFGGTWERISEGRFLAGAGLGTDQNSTTRFLSGGNNAGEYTHTLSIAEMPAHTHDVNNFRYNGDRDDDENKGYWDAGGTIKTESTGGGEAHNVSPPSFALYVWKRLE